MPVRRLKTYTAERGFVYQYYFVGQRRAVDGSSATEYVFDVTSDRSRTIVAVSVFVEDAALSHWAAAHGRELGETERYATAKLCLQNGLDRVEDLTKDGRQMKVTPEGIEDLLEPLGLDR